MILGKGLSEMRGLGGGDRLQGTLGPKQPVLCPPLQPPTLGRDCGAAFPMLVSTMGLLLPKNWPNHQSHQFPVIVVPELLETGGQPRWWEFPAQTDSLTTQSLGTMQGEGEPPPAALGSHRLTSQRDFLGLRNLPQT